MSISKPLATISKYSGMSGTGGLFYSEGFSVKNENGVPMLYENYGVSELINNQTTNFSNLGNPTAIAYLQTLPTAWSSDTFRLIVDEAGKIYTKSTFNTFYSGEIGGIGVSGTFNYSQQPDLYPLPSGNVIYSTANHLSLIIRGLVKTGSSTTKIIDKDGRNFATLGLTTSSPNNTVVNMRTGVKYTITTISTTTATNDTLEFTASGSNDNTANDEFIAFAYTKFDILSGMSVPKFKNQPDTVYWSRPIEQSVDHWLIGNGNYIARLDADETTLSVMYKQLPYQYQLFDMKVNQDRVLVSAVSALGKAYLLYWDNNIDAWNSIMEIDAPARCLANYSSGWVFVVNGVIYWTSGTSITKLGEYTDNKDIPSRNIQPLAINNMVVLNDKIYTTSTQINYNRAMPGVYAFDAKQGWSYTPVMRLGNLYSYPSSIWINPGMDNSFSMSPTIEVGVANSLNRLSSDFSYSSNINSHSAIYFADLKHSTNIKAIELNLTTNLRNYTTSTSREKAVITVNTSNGKDGLFSLVQVTSIPSTTTMNVNGTIWNSNVGDELLLIDNLGGERTYITGITNQGTVNEQWTVSPALSTTYGSNVNIKVIKVKKSQTKTIYLDQLSEPLKFELDGFVGDKIFVEIVINGTTNSFPVSIMDIKLIP